ncbi:MAG: hypothetical protein AAGA02_11525 [Bacteroidota bacterium]
MAIFPKDSMVVMTDYFVRNFLNQVYNEPLKSSTRPSKAFGPIGTINHEMQVLLDNKKKELLDHEYGNFEYLFPGRAENKDEWISLGTIKKIRKKIGVSLASFRCFLVGCQVPEKYWKDCYKLESSHFDVEEDDEADYYLGKEYEKIRSFFRGYNWYSVSGATSDKGLITLAKYSFEFDDVQRTCVVSYHYVSDDLNLFIQGGLRHNNDHISFALKDSVHFKFFWANISLGKNREVSGYTIFKFHNEQMPAKEILFGIPFDNSALNDETNVYLNNGFIPYETFIDYAAISKRLKFYVANKYRLLTRYPALNQLGQDDFIKKVIENKFIGEYLLFSRFPGYVNCYVVFLIKIDQLSQSELKTFSIDSESNRTSYLGLVSYLNDNKILHVSFRNKRGNKAELLMERVKPIRMEPGKGTYSYFKGKTIYTYDNKVQGESFIGFRRDQLNGDFDVDESVLFNEDNPLYEKANNLCSLHSNLSLKNFLDRQF